MEERRCVEADDGGGGGADPPSWVAGECGGETRSRGLLGYRKKSLKDFMEKTDWKH